jgi:hypothetical protein
MGATCSTGKPLRAVTLSTVERDSPEIEEVRAVGYVGYMEEKINYAAISTKQHRARGISAGVVRSVRNFYGRISLLCTRFHSTQ